MPQEVAPLFELAIGIHPFKERHMTEEEEQYPFLFLRYTDREQFLNKPQKTDLEKLALQWLQYLPEIDNIICLPKEQFYIGIWEEIFKKVEPIVIAYAFYPVDLTDLIKRREIRIQQREMQRKVEQKAAEKRKRSVIWTFPFPSFGDLGDIVERKIGLDVKIKQKLAINSYPSGLFFNYLLSRKEPINEILDPHQFEDLIGLAFEEEGWELFRMKKTRDGGKDAIIRKTEGNNITIAYIQAKRYAESNKVKLHEVKEFAATIHWDNIDKGYLVTTSNFTGPAVDWLKGKSLSPAIIIETIDRQGLLYWLGQIVGKKEAVYLLE
jgi:hypothetical protein